MLFEHQHDHLGPCPAERPEDEIVRVSCVRHIYTDQTEINLCGLDFVVHAQERVAILGANGSGKTTLLFHLLGLLRSEEGYTSVFGRDPSTEFRQVRERIGVVLQNADDQILSPTVWEDIAFSPRNYGYPPDRIRQLVEEIMEELRITHLAGKVPHYLSGGERRKVALAGALVLRPQLLILDEPFTGLDPQSRHELVLLLNHFNRDHHMAVILSTHDIDLVSQVADQIYVVSREGGIILKGGPADILSRPEILQKNHLETPILTDLFLHLQARGLPLTYPADIDEAINQILGLVHRHGSLKTEEPRSRGT